MATYHITTTGVDTSGRDGLSTATAWATLSYACTRVSGTNTIYIHNGTYTWSSQILLPVNISIQGESKDGVIISSYYSVSNSPLIKLETSNGWLGTYGNQTISNLTIEGNSTLYIGIQVNFRSNVIIHDVVFQNCLYHGTIYWGMPDWMWTVTSVIDPAEKMPNYWCTGNEVYNCTFYNNVQTGDGGQLSYGAQDGIKIYNNTFDQPLVGSGTNCGGVKFYDGGYNKNVDFHDNHVHTVSNPGNIYNFSLEMWNDLGGCRYYNNRFIGTVDMSGCSMTTGTYSCWFYSNDMGFDSYPSLAQDGNRQQSFGIEFEGPCDNFIVSGNYIHHVGTGIGILSLYPIGTHTIQNIIHDFWIYNNLLVYLGLANNAANDWEPIMGIDFWNDGAGAGTDTIDNGYIWNNVIHLGQTTPNSYYATGIFMPYYNIVATDLYIQNNIFLNWNSGTTYSAAIFGTALYGSTNSVNRLYINYNDFYNNTNNILFVSGYSPTNYTSTPNLTSNPSLDSNWKIQNTSSPAYHAGTNVGLSTDYAGASWNNPPSMGAYEYIYSLPTVTTASISSITSTTAVGGGNVTHDGYLTVTGKGVCWSTSVNPTISDEYTSDDTGEGSFVSNIIDLTPGTTYHVRAYAINSLGIAYGSDVEFTTEVGDGVDDYVLVSFANVCKYSILE